MKSVIAIKIVLAIFFSIGIRLSANSQTYKNVPPSVFDRNWTEPASAHQTEVKAMLKKLLAQHKYPMPEIKTVRSRQLNCYENGWLHEVEGTRGDTIRLYSIVAFPNARYLLTDKVATIYEINKVHGVHLNTFRAQLDYSRLFISNMSFEGERYRAFGQSKELQNLETPASFASMNSTGIMEFRKQMLQGQDAEIKINLRMGNVIHAAEIAISDSGVIRLIKDTFLFKAPLYSEVFNQGGYMLAYKPMSVTDGFVTDDRKAEDYFRKGVKTFENDTTQTEWNVAYQGVEDAAALGHSGALQALAYMLRNGIGVEKDDYKADILIERVSNIERSMKPEHTKTSEENEEEEVEDVTARNKAIAANLINFKVRMPLSLYNGKKNLFQVSLFNKPMEFGGYFYDAFVIEPKNDGYLYWSYSFADSTTYAIFGWYILEYSTDERELVSRNENGFFREFRALNNGRTILQRSNAMLKNGRKYIMWFRHDDIEKYGSKAYAINVSISLLKDLSVELISFFEEQ